MSYPLGVDVGTTYTAAALWRDGRVQTVPLGNRANAVPSVAYLREDGTLLVGEAAVRRGIAEPGRAAREFKRRMGDDVPILLGGRGFAAHELTGHVLRWAVERVSELQGGPPSHIVLTYPAEWGDYRRGLYIEAARTAGFSGVGLLAEPVAAATWYAAQERVEPGALIGIYDLGGGTFDASVVRKTPTGMEIFGEPGGDDSIGGVDFDHALLRHVVSSAGLELTQFDFGDRDTAAAMAQLLSTVVETKEALSADIDAVVPVMLPGHTTQVLVTRADFESLIRAQVLGTVGVFGRVVRRAGVNPTALHAVLLVGGSSRIPLVRELLAAELGIRVAVDAHPKYTVCLGAAIAAAPRILAGGAPTRPPVQPPVQPPVWPQYRPAQPPHWPAQPLPSQPAAQPPPAQQAAQPSRPLPTQPRSGTAAPPGSARTPAPQPAVPPGQPSAPPGQPTAPPGQPAVHPGQPPVYPGQPAMRPGQPALPPGWPTVSPGRPTMPPGSTAVPPGRSTVPVPAPSPIAGGAEEWPPAAESASTAVIQVPAAEPSIRVAPGPPPTEQAPAVAEQIDLAGTGLTSATDVPIVVPPIVIPPPPASATGQTVIRTRERQGAGSGLNRRRFAILGLLLLLAAAVAIVVVLASRDGGGNGLGGGSDEPGPGDQDIQFAGTVHLSGQMIAEPDGADAMRAIAALPNGDRVAVGVSLQLQPRAWVSRGGGPPTFAEVPADQQGTLADVAGAAGGAVAVGWTGTGPARRPAVWTSPDGATWRLLEPAGDFAPGTGIAELTAVTTAKDGSLLATGIDRRADPADGDIAVFRSTDGRSWSRVPATGLDGPGPQIAQRLTVTSSGQFVAVGSALQGARRGPAIWTSTDGAAWQPSPFVPDGSPTLWAIAERPDATLLACGSVGLADRPAVGCWTQQGQQRWQPFNVAADPGSPTPLYLYGLLSTGDDLTAVGVGQTDSTVDATTWTARPN